MHKICKICKIYAVYAVYGQYALYAEYVKTPFICELLLWYATDMQKICKKYEKMQKKYEHPVFHMHLYAEYEHPPNKYAKKKKKKICKLCI